MNKAFWLAAVALALPAPVMAKSSEAEIAAAKTLLMQGVGFRTVEGQGRIPAYAAHLAAVLRQAGYADADIVITPMGETATLAATLKGSGSAKPIVLLGHMDVVEAKAADWTRDPFVAVEEGGYVFGRGAQDNKYDVTLMVATMAKLKRDGFRPKRDIVLVLSGDEETSMVTTQALAARYKNAELALNGDGGGGLLATDGKTPLFYGLQAGEKTYADFRIVFTDPGGHSSAPTATNPLYRLAKALDRLSGYRFANMQNELTKASLQAGSMQVGGEIGAAMARYAADPKDAAAADIIAARPEYIGQIRTTCTATMASAGHAENALPQRAEAIVNCRIFPGIAVETIKTELTTVIADQSAVISVIDDATASDASPLRADVIAAVTKAVKARYPALKITPSMSAGATDSLHFRAAGVPSYGVSALFNRAEDEFAHGLNERVPIDTLGAALDQWEAVLRDLGSR